MATARLTDFDPEWNSDKCIQCLRCVAFCPQNVILPVIVRKGDLSEDIPVRKLAGSGGAKDLVFTLRIDVSGCIGCGTCVAACPKNALEMRERAKVSPRALDGSVYEEVTLSFGSSKNFKSVQFCALPPLLKETTPLHKPIVRLVGRLFPKKSLRVIKRNVYGALGGLSDGDWIVGSADWAYATRGSENSLGFTLEEVLGLPQKLRVLILESELFPRHGLEKMHGEKRDIALSSIAMGSAFVGACSLEANPAHSLKVLNEASTFDGTSLVFALAPSARKADDSVMTSVLYAEVSVASGTWILFRFKPDSGLIVDSKPPVESTLTVLDPTLEVETSTALLSSIRNRYAAFRALSKSPLVASDVPKSSVPPPTELERRVNDIDVHPILSVASRSYISFTFEGISMKGLEGEMISTALLANDKHIFGFHHRDKSPQGMYCANGQCSQCAVIADGKTVKSCMTPLKKGMSIEKCVVRTLPVVAQEKEGGEIPVVKFDVLIVGGGPSGLTCGLELGKKGVKTLLIDDKDRLGGKLVLQTHKFFGSVADSHAGDRGMDIGTLLEEELRALDSVTIKLQTTALGVFGDQIVGIFDQNLNRYSLVRPKVLMVATGAREKFLAFPGNTVPGVYGAGAFQTLVNRDLVLPGRRLLVVGGGNVGLITAYHAMQAGATVVALVEALPECGGYAVHRDKLVRFGVPIFTRHTVKEVLGTNRIEKVVLCEVNDRFQPIDGSEKVYDNVDTVLLAVGLSQADEFVVKAKKFNIPLFVGGDAEEIAEASSAMMSGRIHGLKILKHMGIVSDVDERLKELEFKQKVLRQKPGAWRSAKEMATINNLDDIISGKVGEMPLFHCHQEIPCNFCDSVCPQDVMQKTDHRVDGLPIVVAQKCVGCFDCVVGCPGLAITVVQQCDDKDLFVWIPYEMPDAFVTNGKPMVLCSRLGDSLGVFAVEEIAERENKTKALKFRVPHAIANEVAGFQFQVPEQPHPLVGQPGRSYVCRCERVEEEEIRKAVQLLREQGNEFFDINQIKQLTRVGMGSCGGKTCTDVAQRIVRSEGVSPGKIVPRTDRVLFAETRLGVFAGLDAAGPLDW